jgi:hypothetical protein
MKKQYKLVVCWYVDALNEHVTKLLSEGWELYGPPFNEGRNYCQALTFTPKPVNDGQTDVTQPHGGAHKVG